MSNKEQNKLDLLNKVVVLDGKVGVISEVTKGSIVVSFQNESPKHVTYDAYDKRTYFENHKEYERVLANIEENCKRENLIHFLTELLNENFFSDISGLKDNSLMGKVFREANKRKILLIKMNDINIDDFFNKVNYLEKRKAA